ncbi:MAG: DUF1501 domain-containing protein [Verrucomicrobia bacterium]|nr:DUF1501 domain-containing protein [Verrucomicrobiota bacterium]
MGFGAMSLAGLMAEEYAAQAAAPTGPLAPKQPHYPAKAKYVIHIFAQGAPSHVDTWDPKPELSKNDDKPLPGLNGVGFGSPFTFKKSGKSGVETSEVFPQLAKHIDEMAVIRSMYTDIPSHEVASVMMNTGSLRLAKPSVGSWVLYGLGSNNQNMPGFISLRPGGVPPGGTQNWQSAFLPGVFQGTSINTSVGNVDQLIENIKNQFTPLSEQRRQLDLVNKLNTIHSQTLQKDAQLEARLEAYEMAFKMQTEATDAFDINKESQATRDMYGTSAQGKQLLIARRLVEKGVRFVQVWDGGWDHHQNLETALANKAQGIDGPAAALLADLKQRGLLDQTLVVWGGEFGRTVTRDRNGGGAPGRDHNNRAFSVWMAGGGVKGGTAYGATDEFGARAVTDKVHIHDLHATMLALLGFDHTKLTYRYNGRDFRLTDNFGNVVKPIIA